VLEAVCGETLEHVALGDVAIQLNGHEAREPTELVYSIGP
jgi:hypothetical protein